MKDFLAPEHPKVIVDTSLTDQLPLSCIPERIVRSSRLELLGRIEIRTPVGSMLFESFLRPVWKRLVSVIIGFAPTHVQADLTPCHQLVHERLGALSHVPKSIHLSVGLRNLFKSPSLLARCNRIKYFVGADVPEV